MSIMLTKQYIDTPRIEQIEIYTVRSLNQSVWSQIFRPLGTSVTFTTSCPGCWGIRVTDCLDFKPSCEAPQAALHFSSSKNSILCALLQQGSKTHGIPHLIPRLLLILCDHTAKHNIYQNHGSSFLTRANSRLLNPSNGNEPVPKDDFEQLTECHGRLEKLLCTSDKVFALESIATATLDSAYKKEQKKSDIISNAIENPKWRS
ncbi:hypothetical protein GQ44DRAFT_722537 [Phaeosphaeriaceae sp. PMI808]|nr:hypothetical protein GQ44DRAFT_722537 [Phaeosphaeriaceae sp. PMI808]